MLQISIEGGRNKANERNGGEGKGPATRASKRRLSEKAAEKARIGTDNPNTLPLESIPPLPKRSRGEKKADESAEGGGGLPPQGAVGNEPASASPSGTALGAAPTSTGTQIYCYGPVNYYYGPVNREKE